MKGPLGEPNWSAYQEKINGKMPKEKVVNKTGEFIKTGCKTFVDSPYVGPMIYAYHYRGQVNPWDSRNCHLLSLA